ncbi:hypothetical protein ACVI1I_006391 [Bradyrhizobium sp. USDA 4459]
MPADAAWRSAGEWRAVCRAERGFTFEQQSKPFGVTEAASLTGGFDVGEGLGHAVEAEGVEAVEGRMGEQGTVS